MAELSGQEAAIEISEKNPDVPIVLMSGYDEIEVNNNFDESVLAGTLQKPVANKVLLEMLSSVMGKKK